MKMIVIKQEQFETMKLMNEMKRDNMFVVLNEFNGYSTICQYSKKYDNFHINDVPSDKLDRNLEIKSGDLD